MPAQPERLPERLYVERMPTVLGDALLVTDPSGALRAFNWSDYETGMRRTLRARYGEAPILAGPAPAATRAAFEAYFAGELHALEAIPWEAAGTEFQRAVWKALCTIRPGETLSYAGLAARVGRPKAMRAVGLANGQNPVALVAPCHRVIGSDLTLTGYGGGLARKRWLLTHEGAQFREAASPLRAAQLLPALS